MYEETKNLICKKNIGIIKFILIAVLLGVFVFSAIQLCKYISEIQENKKVKNELSNHIAINDFEQESKIDVDFKTLKEKNGDTVAFLRVKGTDIEYVVVKGEDNNYYLSHNFDGKPNRAGWIFADYRNKLDGSDKNIVVYGHNMKDGSMFATMKNVLEPKWQDEEGNRYIDFVTEIEKSTYQVFSVYQIETEDYYNMTEFLNNISYEKFLDKLKSRSNKDFNVQITSRDRVLTLSTCANNANNRIVLHAKKI